MEQTPPTPSPSLSTSQSHPMTTDPQHPPPPPSPPPPTTISPPSPPPSLSQPSTPFPSSTSSSSTIPSSPNPNPNSKPQTPQQPSITQNPQTRPPFNRTWQQTSHFSHFSSPTPSSSSSPSPAPMPSFSSPATASLSVPPQRGGMAIGVPAHHPNPSTPPTSFSPMNSPSFGHQFGGLGRSSANVPDSITNSSSSQVRHSITGIQGMGSMGSFGSGSQLRPSGVATHHQQRAAQSSLRPTSTSTNQSPASQGFPGHSLLRVPSVGSPGMPSPSAPQSSQPHTQPWLSGSQGKPPLPSPPFRPQTNAQSLSQRSHIPQQHHHPMSTPSHQQQTPSPQQPSPSNPPQENIGQQFTPRVTQSITHQLQMARNSTLGNQKPSSQGPVQSGALQSGPPNQAASTDAGESCNRILSKRTIHELVTQIDPSERLEPEVEDILVDIAEEFVESITTFGCSLAKHRKSNTLEAKDILLHLERNWNMTLPGFSGDEIKCYRKPFASDIHRERLAVIKKSMAGAESASAKSSAGQVAGSAKGHLAKAPTNLIGSPPASKIREAA